MPTRRGFVATRVARNPFELWIVVACTFTGLVALLPLGVAREGIVDRVLPQAATLWYSGLLTSGLVTSIGVFLPVKRLRRASYALLLEISGLCALTGILLGYGAALEVAAPRSPAGLLTLALGAACATRAFQARRELRDLVKQVAIVRRAMCNPTSERPLSD